MAYFRVVYDVAQLLDNTHVIEVTTMKGIPGLYHYGIYLQEIFFTSSNCQFSGSTIYGSIYTVSKFTVGHTYSLLDLETYKKFNLDIFKNMSIIDLASEHGRIDVLNWCVNSNHEFNYTSHAMDYASKHGHTIVLNWWLNMKLKLKLQYTHQAIALAYFNNKSESVIWWYNSGLKIKNYNSVIKAYVKNNLERAS
jgi:hypothetical protein